MSKCVGAGGSVFVLPNSPAMQFCACPKGQYLNKESGKCQTKDAGYDPLNLGSEEYMIGKTCADASEKLVTNPYPTEYPQMDAFAISGIPQCMTGKCEPGYTYNEAQKMCNKYDEAMNQTSSYSPRYFLTESSTGPSDNSCKERGGALLMNPDSPISICACPKGQYMNKESRKCQVKDASYNPEVASFEFVNGSECLESSHEKNKENGYDVCMTKECPAGYMYNDGMCEKGETKLQPYSYVLLSSDGSSPWTVTYPPSLQKVMDFFPILRPDGKAMHVAYSIFLSLVALVAVGLLIYILVVMFRDRRDPIPTKV